MPPTPWPAPQMSFQGLARVVPKLDEAASAAGRSAGSRPAATMLAFR
ncbi:Uncharacterised protein [Bordetella pertussis]|nr:Uncharacterised protein [Bordetella pertussis]